MLNRILNYFIGNHKAILASFSLAFILWFVVTTNKEYTTKIYVPFSIQRIAKGKIPATKIPERVLLEVRGKGRSLFSLNFLEKNFVLELPDVERTTVIQLDEYLNYISLPSELGIEIIDIVEPKSIELVVDHLLETRKPVRVRSAIKPAPGYILMDVISETDSITVSGPASLINPVDFIETDSILARDVKYPFHIDVNLVSPAAELVRIAPKRVSVSFVLEQLVERNIYNIPIRIVRLPANLTAKPEPESIMLRVKGGESLISELKPEDISVIFDYSKDYQPEISEYVMQIETPLGISWIDASPQKFRLKLTKKE